MYKEGGVLKDSEVGKMEMLNKQLEILQSKLNETKNQANQTKNEIKEALNPKKDTLNSTLEGINNKIEKFGKKITRLLLTTFVFNVIRSGLNSLRNELMSLLKTDSQFSNSLNQIKANLMTAFTPIYQAILPAINSLMTWLSKLTGTIAVFVSGLFGKSINQTKQEADKLTKSLKNTAKAGESVNESLSSIDEINNISETESGGGAAAADTSGIDFSGEVQYSEKLLSVLNKIKNVLSPIYNFFKKFYKEHGGWKTAILAIGTAFGTWFILKKILNMFKSAKNVVKGFSADFTGFFNGLGEAAKTIALLGGLALLFKSISKLIKTFAESGLKVTDVLGLMATLLGTVVGFMGAIALLGPSMTAGLVPFLVVIGGISALLLVMEKTLPKILESVGDFIDTVAPHLIKLMETIGNNISKIIYALGTSMPPIIKSIGDLFDSVFNGIANIVEKVGGTIEKVLNAVKSLVKEVLNSLLNFVNELGPAINNLVDGIIQAVTKLINFVISGMEFMVNQTVIKALKGIVKGLNKVLPEKYELSVPDEVSFERFVPKLAKGAVIPPRQEFMAILGDQKHGTNIEAPLDTIKQGVRDVIGEGNVSNSEITDMMFDVLSLLQEIADKPSGIELDGKELAKNMYKYNQNEEVRRNNSSSIKVG